MPFQSDATPSFSGSNLSANRAKNLMFAQSTSNCSSSPSLCTLTTTSSPPSFKVALCTCAKDAAASGYRSNVANTSDMSLICNSSLTMVMARSGLNEGTSFCRVANSLITSGGRTSTLVDNSCPNLMNVGPNRSNASLKSAASFDRAATASDDDASLNFRLFRATLKAKPTAVRQIAVVLAAALNLLNLLLDVIVGTVARAPAAAQQIDDPLHDEDPIDSIDVRPA